MTGLPGLPCWGFTDSLLTRGLVGGGLWETRRCSVWSRRAWCLQFPQWGVELAGGRGGGGLLPGLCHHSWVGAHGYRPAGSIGARDGREEGAKAPGI